MFEEKAELEDVELGIVVALVRHLALSEVLRPHMELGQRPPSLHQLIYRWFELGLHKVKALSLIRAIIAVGTNKTLVEKP